MKKEAERPCARCGKEKEASQYGIRRNGYRRSWCKGCVNLYNRMYRESGKKREGDRLYRKKHSQRLKAYQRAYRNGARRQELLREKREWGMVFRNTPEGKEYIRAKARRLYWRDPINYRLRRHIDRQQRHAAPGQFTKDDFLRKCEEYGWCCYLCSAPLTQKTVVIEHRIPISRGGSNWPNNIAPACKACNVRKANRTEEEYRVLRGLGSISDVAEAVLGG